MKEYSQSDAIREAVYNNPTINNRGSKTYCSNHYDFVPSNALIYEVAGSAKLRGLNKITAGQMVDIKSFAKDKFDNDLDALVDGVLAVRQAVS